MSNILKNIPKTVKVNIVGDNNTVIFNQPTISFTGSIYIGFVNAPTYNAKLIVDENTSCNGIEMFIFENNSSVTIGKNCMLADRLQIWASDTHTIIDAEDNILNWGKNIIIGNHVWIGRGATILKNTIIADNCIVGLNSVVSGEFHQVGSVIVGNPGRVVKQVHNWNRLRPNLWLAQHPGIKI